VYDSDGKETRLDSLKMGQVVSVLMSGQYAVSVSIKYTKVNATPAASSIAPLTADQTGVTQAVKAYCKGSLGARAVPRVTGDSAIVSAKCKATDGNDLVAGLKKANANWTVIYLGAWPPPPAVTQDCSKYLCLDGSSSMSIVEIDQTSLRVRTYAANQRLVGWTASAPPVVKDQNGNTIPYSTLRTGQRIRLKLSGSLLTEIDLLAPGQL
jgi:hypothetical protein